MKQKLTLFAVLAMALAMPQSGFAYTFTAVAPSGQTLYYNLSGGTAIVTCSGNPGSAGSWLSGTRPTGDLIIPDSVIYQGTTYPVVSIGDYTFGGCTGLSSVTIPNTVSSIGYSSFNGCTGLDTLLIPNSVLTIGQSAFGWCTGLTYASVPTLNINMFRGCNNLTSVVITMPFTGGIPYQTFYGCSNLASIVISGSVTTIGYEAFRGCSSLSTINLSSALTNIGYSAFNGCGNLSLASLPDSLITIGDSAFYGTALTTVTIPTTLTSIGKNAFSACNSLTVINYNAINCTFSCNEAVKAAFWSSNNVSSLSIGDSVRVIPAYLFYGCPMTTLTVGNAVTNIGASAFAFCTHLSSITMRGYPPSVNSGAFAAIPINTPIYTPCGALTSYQNSQYWSNFTHFVNGCVSITATPNDYVRGGVSGSGTYTMGDSVSLTATPFYGYLFAGWSNGSQDNPLEFIATQDQSLVAAFVPGPLPRDTVYLHDTTILHDTIIIDHYDTTIVTDTLWLTDTVFLYDTVVVYDTVYITGVENAEPLDTKIYARDGQIVVEGAGGYTVTLYDAVGRLLATKEALLSGEPCEFGVAAIGVYLVKIGPYPARRIVVRM